MIRSSITFVASAKLVYVEVILPLAVPGTFTYTVPEGMEVLPGMRVAVPFGRGRKLYGALVRRTHNEDPLHRKPRPILSVLDTAPIVRNEQLELWDRISDYYMCTLGEVLIAALPGQLSLSSETRLVAGPMVESFIPGQERAVFLLNALEDGQVVTLEQAGELLGLKDPLPVVKRLMEQGALLLEEQLKQDWKPRMATYIRLDPESSDRGGAARLVRSIGECSEATPCPHAFRGVEPMPDGPPQGSGARETRSRQRQFHRSGGATREEGTVPAVRA
jgi:primosomal protein N' (replication factor Y)